jgi:hypothetical protein
MPVNTVGTTADIPYYGTIANLSAASIAYIPVSKAGRLVSGYVAQSAATTVAPAVVTIRKFPGGVAASTVACGTITVTHTGSGIGSVSQFVPTGTEAACTFAPGDTLVIDNAAGSTTASVGNFSLLIRGV